MRALFDINVLLALSDERHVSHDKAKRWRLSESNQDWASCPLTQNGFLRISSHRSYSNPISLPDGFKLLSYLVERPDHQFWPDDLTLLDPDMIDHTRVLSHRRLTDVYLLALAVKNGGRFVTLDSGISYQAVRTATASQLVVI